MSSYVITVSPGGESFPCRADEYVLTAMLRSGVGPIRYGCCGGGCGICKMRVVAGEYEKAKKMSRAHVSEIEELSGVVLLCCIKPRSDITIAKGD